MKNTLEELIKFAEKVHSLPPEVWEDRGIKGNSKLREVAQLLCGTLWHLDYALTLGALDPTPVSKRDKHQNLWREWLETARVRDKPPSLVQDMLVSDASLRLAGVVDRLREKKQLKKVIKKYLEGEATALEQAIARVVIHRDSFMHAEFPDPKSKDPRWKARAREMLAETYNIAQLLEDCLIVGCQLAEEAKEGGSD
jgi:hypothetical protein